MILTLESVKLCLQFLSDIASSVYLPSDGYRISLFFRNDKARDEIVPVFRWTDNPGSILVNHPTVFIRKGQVIAGRAWEKPDQIHVLLLPEFATKEDFVDYYRKDLRFDDVQAERLGEGKTYRYRSILCTGLHEDNERPIVLSIDSVDYDGFVEIEREGADEMKVALKHTAEKLGQVVLQYIEQIRSIL